MHWIKEANKLGKYDKTYQGFRIYCTKEPESIQRMEEREDGQWNVTDFIQGEYIAIDKTGLRYDGKFWDFIIPQIDKEAMRRQMSKRYKEELEWT